MRRAVVTFVWTLVLGLCAVAAHAAVSVQIVSPTQDQVVFGPTEIKVQVQAMEPITKVEVFVNGKLVGTMTQPPYELTWDAGEENVKRDFRVVAHGLSGQTAASAVVTAPVQIDEQMDLKLQQLFVTVNRGEHRALDLDQEDFRISDNGKSQQIVTFGRGELPLTAVLLIDASESMLGERLEGARRGATAFLNGMKTLDEAAVVLFSDRLLHVTPFSEEKASLAKSLTNVEAAGGSAVNDFLYMSLKLVEPRLGRRVVILLSDGSDVHSAIPMSEVLWKSRTGQAMIYWIQLEGGEKHKSYASAWRGRPANDKEYETLEKSVLESGGRIVPIERIGELEYAFQSILQELREQYVLGYYPTDVRKDGRWHDVKVDVRRSGVRVRTRDGYVDF